MHLPRFMLAAPSSGSGKTMITCGILEALKQRGQNPASFKCGPDYIDPMFHTRVLGTPSRNLDPFFTDQKTLRYLFANRAQHAGISVMEGVMGLYDGLGGITSEASSYDLACKTETPVILVVSAKGMSLSLIPFLKGFVDYQKPESRVIRGVILNRVTKMTAGLLKEKIETETGLKLIGYVPDLDACRIESRHLGLVTPGEIQDLQDRIKNLAAELEQCIDFEALNELAQQAPDFSDEERKQPEIIRKLAENYGLSTEDSIEKSEENESAEVGTLLSLKRAGLGRESRNSVRIAVARDEAFCFYYQDNLELLERFGAELVPFSPLHDRELPENVDALIIGGGYPELYAKQLSENETMKQSVVRAVQDGMPYLAECGGFMYLHERMQDMQDEWYPMVGVIPGDSYRTKRLGRFGYITLSTEAGQLLPEGQTVRGHEFHYFDSTNAGSDYHAVKPVTGRSWDCIHGSQKGYCGYPHLYFWSNPELAARFVLQADYFRRLFQAD